MGEGAIVLELSTNHGELSVVNGEIHNYPTEADSVCPAGLRTVVAQAIMKDYAGAQMSVCSGGVTEVLGAKRKINSSNREGSQGVAQQGLRWLCLFLNGSTMLLCSTCSWSFTANRGCVGAGDPTSRLPCASTMLMRALCGGVLAAGRTESEELLAGVVTCGLWEIGVVGAGVATTALALRARGKGQEDPRKDLALRGADARAEYNGLSTAGSHSFPEKRDHEVSPRSRRTLVEGGNAG